MAIFSSLKNGLKRTSSAMGLGRLFSGAIDDDLLDDLEERLLMADIGPSLSLGVVDRLRDEMEAGTITDGKSALAWLRAEMLEVLTIAGQAKSQSTTSGPSVWYFLGVNGVGKTTSLGKLAKRLTDNGFSLLLAAGDTFRAAASEQLSLWADKCGAQIVKHREGGDPSAVVFDAYEAAKKRSLDFCLVDTAGRLHNKKNLMAECAKMFRTVERQGGKAEEVFLVLDASTGQNAVQQARLFSEVAPLTGLILTKLDGSAKGGVIFQLASEAKVPVRYIGVGEKAEDLLDFDPEAFVDAILSREDLV